MSTEILACEIRQVIQTWRGKIDWITFVASGEPSLHIDIGWLIRLVKDSTDIPVAVITNGSLLHLRDVARELAMADAVLPSLDAGGDSLYQAINRPHPRLTYESLRRGLAEFRQSYRGRYWVEVMLVGGVNDTEPALRQLAEALQDIAPDEVHISTPFRMPAESWVREPTTGALALAKEIFGTRARVLMPARADAELGGNSVEALAEAIARHPMPEEEVRATLAVSQNNPEDGMCHLAKNQTLQRIYWDGRWYWCPARGHYGNAVDRRR
jgi:wyosine [tRNA(Phe)-imidazoG37] synthetase (radical SAM superfamily)